MFNVLTRYLFEHRQLVVPQTGVFELKPKAAITDQAANTLSPPGWTVTFSEERANETVTDDSLYSWLMANKNISKEVALNDFEAFAADVRKKLDNNEAVDWTGLGRLVPENGTIIFIPEQEKISPFTNVTAKKITREHTNYTTCLKRATSHKCVNNCERAAQGRNKIMWLLLTVL